MAITYVKEWFTKVGRGVPQTEQVDASGKPILEDGKPVIGNEQYQADQLTDESVDFKDADYFMADVLEATKGNLELAASAFREGFNKHLKNQAGGLDEYQKAARGLIKLGIPWTKGLSVDQVAEKVKAMNA